MSLFATQQDFEPATPEEGASALYYEPGNADGITGYRDFEAFTERVNQLKQRLAPNGQKAAIWGCGFGYMVRWATDAGYDAHGFDASAYAIGRGQTLLPNYAGRLHIRNALLSADMTPARRDAGLQGAQRFSLLVTEDLLTCMSDQEISVCLPLLRGICSTNLGHIVTPLEQAGENRDSRINWKTIAEWKAIVSPPDILLGVNGEVL